jgi:hypothetical protein
MLIHTCDIRVILPGIQVFQPPTSAYLEEREGGCHRNSENQVKLGEWAQGEDGWVGQGSGDCMEWSMMSVVCEEPSN